MDIDVQNLDEFHGFIDDNEYSNIVQGEMNVAKILTKNNPDVKIPKDDVVTKQDLKEVDKLAEKLKIPEPPIKKVDEGGSKTLISLIGVGLIIGAIYYMYKTK